jgi:hypothetical protein
MLSSKLNPRGFQRHQMHRESTQSSHVTPNFMCQNLTFRSHTDQLGKHLHARAKKRGAPSPPLHSTLQTPTCSGPDFFCTTSKRPKLYSQLPEVILHTTQRHNTPTTPTYTARNRQSYVHREPQVLR